MDIKDTFRYLVGAYYGVLELDEYSTKEYILKDIEDYIRDFVNQNKNVDFDYHEEANDVLDNVSLKVKLQDALIVLPKVHAQLEIILIVKNRLRMIREEELEEL